MNLPTVGQIEVTWYAPVPGASTLALPEKPAPTGMGGETASEADKGAPVEEAVASGWGDDGEDGMGML